MCVCAGMCVHVSLIDFHACEQTCNISRDTF